MLIGSVFVSGHVTFISRSYGRYTFLSSEPTLLFVISGSPDILNSVWVLSKSAIPPPLLAAVLFVTVPPLMLNFPLLTYIPPPDVWDWLPVILPSLKMSFPLALVFRQMPPPPLVVLLKLIFPPLMVAVPLSISSPPPLRAVLLDILPPCMLKVPE